MDPEWGSPMYSVGQCSVWLRECNEGRSPMDSLRLHSRIQHRQTGASFEFCFYGWCNMDYVRNLTGRIADAMERAHAAAS